MLTTEGSTAATISATVSPPAVASRVATAGVAALGVLSGPRSRTVAAAPPTTPLTNATAAITAAGSRPRPRGEDGVGGSGSAAADGPGGGAVGGAVGGTVGGNSTSLAMGPSFGSPSAGLLPATCEVAGSCSTADRGQAGSGPSATARRRTTAA